MSDKEYNELIELKKTDNGFMPMNEKAMDLLLTSKPYENIFLIECTKRDLKFHRCYFKLINSVYFILPAKFQKTVSEKQFYNFLKCLSGQAKVIYEFKDLPALVEYESINFGNMSQKRFEDFVRDQLNVIYTVLLPKLDCEFYIDEIEENFKKFLKMIEV